MSLEKILNLLNTMPLSNERYIVEKINDNYIAKQFVNGKENKYFDVKYKSENDLINHLENIFNYKMTFCNKWYNIYN